MMHFSLSLKLSLLFTLTMGLTTGVAVILGAGTAVALVAGGAATLLAVHVFVNGHVTGPLNELTKSMRLLELGDFSARLHIGGSSQMKLLSDSFNHMVDRVMTLVDSTAQQVCDMAQSQERIQHIAKLNDINKELENSLAEVRMLHSRQEAVYLSAINALVTTIEASDEYTHGHSTRVTRYSLALADRIGLPAERLSVLEQAAILHDIGKIGIDKSILHKPGRLSAEEYAVMRQHPVIAVNILRHIVHMSDVQECVERHHERYDGKGYPLGVGGDDLLVEARILAIADTFDAMTSNRPYRRGLPIERAISELREHAGSQFDPVLAEHFIELLRERALEVVADDVTSDREGTYLEPIGEHPRTSQSVFPISVLVVDEDPLNCLIVRDFFERIGHQVDTASSSSHGLTLFAAGRYDLVLLDNGLSDADVYGTAGEMRNLERMRQPSAAKPAIMCTLSSRPGDHTEQKFGAFGLNLSLRKPFTTVALMDVIDRVGENAERWSCWSREELGLEVCAAGRVMTMSA